MATLTHTTKPIKSPIAKATPEAGDNVVPLPKRPTAAEVIVAEVTAKSRRESDEISRRLQEMVSVATARHRERANALLPIGVAMDRPMLDDFIEIGQRLLAAKAGA